MKTLITLILLIAAGIVVTSFARANSSTIFYADLPVEEDIDTLEWYTARTHTATRKGKTKYWVNGAAVSKEVYDKYNVTTEEIMACTTCYVRHYSPTDKLLWEADQYTDCLVGNYTTYYPGGKIAVRGTYQGDSTGKYDMTDVSSWCGIKHGTWTYYNQNGSVDSTVNYVNNERAK